MTDILIIMKIYGYACNNTATYICRISVFIDVSLLTPVTKKKIYMHQMCIFSDFILF